MMKIRIKDLKVRTIIGFKEWEREKRQDVTINVTMETSELKSTDTDDINDSIDYKVLTKRLINDVEASEFFLLEKLTAFILNIVMEDDLIKRATVEVEKPHALRFASSASVELTRER